MYDLVLITQLPSFYKVNLYSEIAKHVAIKVIFLGQTSRERTPDFVTSDYNFDHVLLSDGHFEDRSLLSTLRGLQQELRQIQYRKILCTGWNLPEFLWVFFSHAANRNIIGLESSICDSKATGMKGLIKKIILNKVGTVLASGVQHAKLLEAIGYTGKVVLTKGVGIINKPQRKPLTRAYRKRFLFLGRLAPEKNLELIISVFNTHPDYHLTIVGNGPLEDQLKELAVSPEILFLGHVPNDQIETLFHDHDALILGSIREPWGLVVEESLYYQTPVIISDRCGSVDLIQDGKNGYVFDPLSAASLADCLKKFSIFQNEEMTKFISIDSLNAKDAEQVNSYLEQLR